MNSTMAALPRLMLPAALLALTAGLVPPVALGGYPEVPDHHPELSRLLMSPPATETHRAGFLEHNLSLVGFLDLGLSTDVWAHGHYAYVGGVANPSGVYPAKIVDIADPARPRLVATLTPPADRSSPQDVKVARIDTRAFHGDLLVVGTDGDPGGIQLWDVTDPPNPVLLSEPRLGPVHNAWLYQRGRRAFVLLAIPFHEVFSAERPPFETLGDLVVLDVTDPRRPRVVGDWGAGKDGGLPFGIEAPGFPKPCGDPICRGWYPAAFLHDVWANEQGTVAYLAYWDLGLILLDISDPARPSLLGRGLEPPTFGALEGDAHSVVPAQGGNLVLVGDETFAPLPWGFLRVFDTRDPVSPVEVGAFATEGTLSDPDRRFLRSLHNIDVRGNRAYLSWYFEGIRVVDVSRPAHPREIAAFVPEGAIPQTRFWGVYVHRNLVLATDIMTGLFILELRPEAASARPAAAPGAAGDPSRLPARRQGMNVVR